MVENVNNQIIIQTHILNHAKEKTENKKEKAHEAVYGC